MLLLLFPIILGFLKYRSPDIAGISATNNYYYNWIPCCDDKVEAGKLSTISYQIYVCMPCLCSKLSQIFISSLSSLVGQDGGRIFPGWINGEKTIPPVIGLWKRIKQKSLDNKNLRNCFTCLCILDFSSTSEQPTNCRLNSPTKWFRKSKYFPFLWLVGIFLLYPLSPSLQSFSISLSCMN